MKTELMRKLTLIPILAIGVVVLVMLVKNRAEPERLEFEEKVTAARTIEVPSLTVIPRFTGYGTVEPSQVWNSVAQVSGKVTEVDPSFKEGNIIGVDQFLLQIDPTDYELAIAQAETNIESTRAQIAELEIQQKNSQASLAIEKESLSILEMEVQRKEKLVSSGAVSSSELEREQRSVLAQRQSIQNLENTVNLFPAERRRLEAELARLEAQLKSARLDLERTRITMPFVGRIADVGVEQFQFVRQGDRLATADAIAKAEIEVQVPLWRLGALIRSEGITDISELRSVDIGERLGVSARVYLDLDDLLTEWEGRVVRFSDELDPQSRTLGVIVEVDKPYSNIQPGVRPPLVKGFFVRVELLGRPRPNSIVIPRSALHEGHVYIVNSDSRLQRRRVTTEIDAASYYSVIEGLQAGEKIVVSDLVPAIEGMLLDPVDDPETALRLARAARAEMDNRL
ncbi:MAG: efflux RND transporter periplasmic adaptor subunit [Arenicellales bacterium]|nr:efflux RND transporter periplasmic adaptor subunit [Arenicellales bacterium]